MAKVNITDKERRVKPQEPTKISYTKLAQDKGVATEGQKDVVHAVLAGKLVASGMAVMEGYNDEK